MAEQKNYYDILGVSKTASEEEIKAAYKKLVKQYHPDLHPGDPTAAEKFKEINEANEVLTDKQKRAAYDYEQTHPNMGGAGYGGFGGFGGFEDLFGSIFQGFGGRADIQRDTTGQNIEFRMTLSFLDAAKGCVKELTYTRNEPCPTCQGTGAKGGKAFKECKKCGGRGQVRFEQTTMFGKTIRVGACPDCNGTGRVITDKCPSCKGRGYTEKKTKVELVIPAGADNSSYIRKHGFGQASTVGGEPGDLIVSFVVEPHKIFQRKGLDLYVDLPIPFHTAALGGTVKVPGLDNTFDYIIPEGTQSGTVFMVREKGINSPKGIGNLYLKVFVEVPTKLTKDQRLSLREAANEFDLTHFDKSKAYADSLSALYGKDAYKK